LLFRSLLRLERESSVLERFAHEDESVAGTRDGTLDEDRIVLRTDLDDFEIDVLAVDVTHVARHLLALFNPAGEVASRETARTALGVAAVGHVAAGETVALDDARETAALRHARNVDILDAFEVLDGENVADLEVLVALFHLEFLENAHKLRKTRLLLVSELGLRDALFLLDAKTNLSSGISVGLRGLELNYRAGTDFDHGHADALAVLVEDLGHAHFLSDQTFHVLLLTREW